MTCQVVGSISSDVSCGGQQEPGARVRKFDVRIQVKDEDGKVLGVATGDSRLSLSDAHERAKGYLRARLPGVDL